MDEKAELRKSVLINLRCVVESCKNGVPLSCLQNDYKTLIGAVIPFQALGFNSLELFLADNTDVVYLRRSNGTIIVEAVPNSSTSHLAKLISKQKPSKVSKKITSKYANRFRSTNRNNSCALNKNFKTSKCNPNTTTVNEQISTSLRQFPNALNTPSTSEPIIIQNPNNGACGTNSVSQNILKPLNKVNETSQNSPKIKVSSIYSPLKSTVQHAPKHPGSKKSSVTQNCKKETYMVAQEYGGLRTFVLLHMENVAKGYEKDTDLKSFQRDCEKSMGIPFPCQELGYATFKDFVSSINNHFKTRNSKKGNLIIKGNASKSSTSSSCSMTSEQKKKSEHMPHMEKEKFKTEVQSVLNMLTHQNFEILLTQLQSLGIYTEENLKIVVDLILEKAIDEPDCSMECANLCKHLAVFGKFEDISKLLLSKCQTEFEQYLEFRMKLVDCKNNIETAKGENVKELQRKFIEINEKIQLRQLGNIRFIGELFKFNLLIESTIFECIEKLLKQGDEESLECLCLLLKTVGKKLKKSKQNENKLNKIVTEIERIIKEELTTSRVSFMLQDFIDLKTEPVYQSTSHNSCVIERNLSLNSSKKKTFPDSKVIEQKSKGSLKLHPEVKKNILATSAKTLSALHEFLFGATFLDILRAKILSFSGFAFTRNSEEWKDKELLLSLLHIDGLRNFSKLLCIQHSKSDTEDVLIEKILTFLTDFHTKS